MNWLPPLCCRHLLPDLLIVGLSEDPSDILKHLPTITSILQLLGDSWQDFLGTWGPVRAGGGGVHIGLTQDRQKKPEPADPLPGFSLGQGLLSRQNSQNSVRRDLQLMHHAVDMWRGGTGEKAIARAWIMWFLIESRHGSLCC